MEQREAPDVPRGLRVAGAVSWRLLAIAAVLFVLGRIASVLAELVIALGVALLLAALLAPLVDRLTRWGVPRTAATVLALLLGLVVVGGVLALVVITVINGLPGLQAQAAQTVEGVHHWLRTGPLRLSQGQLDDWVQRITDYLRTSQSGGTAGAVSTATTVLSVGSGLLLALFTLIFFLRDGGRIWRFALRVAVPAHVRDRVDVAGQHAFHSLVAYVRASAAVALMDAVGIGVGCALVGVPLSAALAALVFLGAFVPYVGAMITGSIAVLMALVTTGPLPAIIVLAVVVGVMQLEGHVLQPLILGHAVRLHPLAIVLGVTAGFLGAGVAGAVFSVPVIALLNAGIRALAEPPPEPGAEPEAEGAEPPAEPGAEWPAQAGAEPAADAANPD
ncbi:AI-2E family transporter [Saccharopolyspora sp. 7B]|uniref:AI-2E family transporter n=1 Tax=Saccharopolyspora sp. 7B TaxID=2877240 RepID=UPI001CD6E984|nr:AI-2E family transporter [Saccharopolyspora sp. 7B]MCA1282358.1 AI-2E family transporter [Saccharopolyspora sp. 7B]